MKHSLESRTNWKKFHQENDENINYDDIPATDAKFWESAKLVKWDFNNEIFGRNKINNKNGKAIKLGVMSLVDFRKKL